VDTFHDLLRHVRELKQDEEEETGVLHQGSYFWLCVLPAGGWKAAGARSAAGAYSESGQCQFLLAWST